MTYVEDHRTNQIKLIELIEQLVTSYRIILYTLQNNVKMITQTCLSDELIHRGRVRNIDVIEFTIYFRAHSETNYSYL